MAEIQLVINYDRKFDTLDDAIRFSVYHCGRSLKYIAADLGMTLSELSRKLADNPNDPVHFPTKHLEALMEATGDLTPIYYLIDKFLKPKEEEERRLLRELKNRLPEIKKILRLLEGAGG